MAPSWLNLPCALKTAIVYGKRILDHPASLPRHRGQQGPRSTTAGRPTASTRPRRRSGRVWEACGKGIKGIRLRHCVSDILVITATLLHVPPSVAVLRAPADPPKSGAGALCFDDA